MFMHKFPFHLSKNLRMGLLSSIFFYLYFYFFHKRGGERQQEAPHQGVITSCSPTLRPSVYTCSWHVLGQPRIQKESTTWLWHGRAASYSECYHSRAYIVLDLMRMKQKSLFGMKRNKTESESSSDHPVSLYTFLAVSAMFPLLILLLCTTLIRLSQKNEYLICLLDVYVFQFIK